MVRRSLSSPEGGRMVRALERGLCPGAPSPSRSPALRAQAPLLRATFRTPAPRLLAQGRAPNPGHRRGALRPAEAVAPPCCPCPGVAGPLLLRTKQNGMCSRPRDCGAGVGRSSRGLGMA